MGRGGGGGGGGSTQSQKGYQLQSDCWRVVAVATAKIGELSFYYSRIGELSEPVQLIFYIK